MSSLRVCVGASTSAPSSGAAAATASRRTGFALRAAAPIARGRRHRRQRQRSSFSYVVASAENNNSDDDRTTLSNFAGGLDPSLELAVPKDQRPSNELANLRTAPLYSWATLPASGLAARLAALGLASFLLLSGPIAAGTYDPSTQTLEFALASLVGSLLVVGGVGVRLFLGWSYVASRLMSAAVPYEETGWYDGQTFVKPPAVLARDRLLGSYEARPALNRVRGALATAAAGLVAASVSLVLVSSNDGSSSSSSYVPQPVPLRVASDGSGIIYSKNLALEDSLAALSSDDDAAEREAEAMLGRPGYCGDRLLRARAGSGAAACDAPPSGEGLAAVEAARAKAAAAAAAAASER